jgi:hypothetical protein
MPKVVYVGEPGGQNTDVAHETGGKASFQPGDTAEVSEDLANRLDASWATEEEAAQMDIQPSSAAEEGQDEASEAPNEGGSTE